MKNDINLRQNGYRMRKLQTKQLNWVSESVSADHRPCNSEPERQRPFSADRRGPSADGRKADRRAVSA
jgi:hypothetical protein